MTTENQNWIRWRLADLYRRLESYARQRERALAETLLDTEVRRLCYLTLGCGCALAIMPLLGRAGVFGALLVLWVGIGAGVVVGVRRVRQIERTFAPRPAPAERAEAAFRALPPLDGDALARLTRVLNLAPATSSERGRADLALEVAEAQRLPGLRSWPAWDDVLAVAVPPARPDH